MREHEARKDGRDAYAPGRHTARQAAGAVAAGDVERIDALMEPLHSADIADLLEHVTEG